MGRFDAVPPPPDPSVEAVRRMQEDLSSLTKALAALSVPPPSVSVESPSVNVDVPVEGLVNVVSRIERALADLKPVEGADPPVPERVQNEIDLSPLVDQAEQTRLVLDALKEKLSNLTAGTRSHFDGRVRTADSKHIDSGNPLPVTVAGGGGARRIEEGTTDVPLTSANQTFTGDWFSVAGIGALSFFAFSDQPFTAARLEWSDDGITKNTDLLAEADYFASETETGGFFVYYPDPQTYLIAPYARVVLEKTSGTDQALMNAWMWAFPVGSNPWSFLDVDGVPTTLQKALLVKPVNAALDIVTWTDALNGTIPSGAAVTIDPVLNTEPNVLDSGWIDTATFAGKNIMNALADTPVDIYLMNASSATGDDMFGDGAPVITTNVFGPSQLSALYADAFYRMVVVNTSGSPLTMYSLRSEAAPESTDGITTAIEQPVFGFYPAKINRSVVMGRQPDGDYVNVPATGAAYDVDGAVVHTTTPLAAAGTYVSGWIDTDGWDEIELLIAADEVSTSDGIVLDFTDDAQATTPTVVSTQRFTFTASDVVSGSTTVRVAPRGDGVRVSYQNGGQPQGTFSLLSTLRADATALPRGPLEQAVRDDTQAVTTKGALLAPATSDGEWGTIARTDDALNVYSSGSAPVPIEALTTWTSRTRTASTTSSEATSSSPLAGRKTITVKANAQNNKDIFIGPNSAVNSTNARLIAGEGVTLDLDETASVWIISDFGTQAYSVIEIA